MPAAQVIRLNEHQMNGRPRRQPEPESACVVLLFRSLSRHSLPAVAGVAGDDDRFAGRGRDPG
jgi:hypothetical protein